MEGGSVEVVGWWEGKEEMAASLAETLRLMRMIGGEEIGAAEMEEGFREVLGGEGAERLGAVKDEEGRFGMRMVAWTAVAFRE